MTFPVEYIEAVKKTPYSSMAKAFSDIGVFDSTLKECPVCHSLVEDFVMGKLPLKNPLTGHEIWMLVFSQDYEQIRRINESAEQAVKNFQNIIEFLRSEIKRLEETIPPKTMKMKTCRHCGREFYPKSFKSVYCSDTCRAKASRKRRRQEIA